MMQQPTGYCGVTLATNKELLDKLNTTLSQLESQGIIDVIETKWLGASVDISKTKLTAGAKETTQDAAKDDASTDSEAAAEDVLATATA